MLLTLTEGTPGYLWRHALQKHANRPALHTAWLRLGHAHALFMRMQTPAFISAPIDYKWFKIVTNRHKPLVTIHSTITQQLTERTRFSRIGFVTRVFRVSSQTVTNLSQNLVTI